MTNHSNIPQPLLNERPTEYADRVGRWYASSVTEPHKKKYGQYLTPIPVADFMASLVDPRREEVRILDPGAGTGVCEEAGVMQIHPRGHEDTKFDECKMQNAKVKMNRYKSWPKAIPQFCNLHFEI